MHHLINTVKTVHLFPVPFISGKHRHQKLADAAQLVCCNLYLDILHLFFRDAHNNVPVEVFHVLNNLLVIRAIHIALMRVQCVLPLRLDKEKAYNTNVIGFSFVCQHFVGEFPTKISPFDLEQSSIILPDRGSG